MSRLTHYLKDGRTAAEPKNRAEGLAFAAKLAGYEDLEENGLLTKQPCEVGDEVWFIENEDGEYELAGYVFLAVCKNYIIATSDFVHCDGIMEQLEEMSSDSIENYGDVGSIMILPMKDCFFTRYEAEKAMKARENE